MSDQQFDYELARAYAIGIGLLLRAGKSLTDNQRRRADNYALTTWQALCADCSSTVRFVARLICKP